MRVSGGYIHIDVHNFIAPCMGMEVYEIVIDLHVYIIWHVLQTGLGLLHESLTLIFYMKLFYLYLFNLYK